MDMLKYGAQYMSAMYELYGTIYPVDVGIWLEEMNRVYEKFADSTESELGLYLANYNGKDGKEKIICEQGERYIMMAFQGILDEEFEDELYAITLELRPMYQLFVSRMLIEAVIDSNDALKCLKEMAQLGIETSLEPGVLRNELHNGIYSAAESFARFLDNNQFDHDYSQLKSLAKQVAHHHQHAYN